VPALDGRGVLAVASLRRCGASGFSELWARGGAQDLSLAGWTEGVERPPARPACVGNYSGALRGR
jgi:hypothetical protein